MRWAALVPLLAFAGPAHAAGWSCTVHQELAPNLVSSMSMTLGPDRGRTTLTFDIRRRTHPGDGGAQTMNWVAIPHDADVLWKPDWIAFEIPGRADPQGLLLFLGRGMRFTLPTRDVATTIQSRPASTHVALSDAALVARMWPFGSWHVSQSDRESRTTGIVDLLLPAAAEAQVYFTRMRAEMERKAADPEANCQAIADDEPREEDII